MFPAGLIVATPGALSLGIDLRTYLDRHLSGDDGDLSPDDKKENIISLQEGYRIFSAYETPEGKIWIITEADRSATTILLPSEY